MALNNPSSSISEIVATTLRSRTGKLADNVSKNNALLLWAKEKGNVKTVSGGRTILQELEYAENGTFTRYSGYENLNIAPSDTFSGAEFDYAQAAVAVTISGLERLQNSGEEEIINLLESRIENAEKTLTNNISLDCYSDGTASGGRQIGGLQLLVASTPTNTVGGINAGTYPFWQNAAFSAVSNGGSAATSANIQSYMNRIYVQLCRGRDHPDIMIADNNYYRLFLESMQSIQRVTSDKVAKSGFSGLQYMGGDVVLDGGVGGGSPVNSMYFLNSEYIHFRPHVDCNFVPIGEDRFAVNQDAMVKLVGFAGNLTVSNRRLQGVLAA